MGFAIRTRDSYARMVRAEKGQALTFMLIIMAFGLLVIAGFLAYASTAVRVGGRDTDTLLARYAADAGVTDVITDMIQGTDVLSSTYIVPTPTVNNYQVTIAVSTPTPGTQPAATYQYIDPGAAYGFSSLASQAHYYFRIDNVQAGSRFRVNWAFTPNNQKWKIKLYSGTGPPGWVSPAIIAQDDFESGGWSGGSGWLAGWTHHGNVNVTTSGNPYQGSYHVQLSGNSGYAARSANLVGRSNVRLQFWAKAANFNTGNTATASVSSDGVSWSVVRVWQQSDADNVYRFEDIDLSSFSMTSPFWIAFDANMSNSSNNFWVDTVQLASQAQTVPVAQTGDIKGPGALYVGGGLIAGGIYTIDFMNNSGVSLTTSSFSAAGGAGNTWAFIQAYKDYVITSTTTDNTKTAYIRQSPGWTRPTTRQNIYIETWK